MDSARSDVREAEGARLEIWCGACPHRGFESHSLRNHRTPLEAMVCCGSPIIRLLKSVSLFGIFFFSHLERCPSGRRCTIGSRVRSKAFGGSNPPLSVWGQILRCWRHPTPPGPGGSNGKWSVREPQGICPIFFVLNYDITVVNNEHDTSLTPQSSVKEIICSQHRIQIV